MKGKLDIRFDMPNVAKIRTRIDNPSKELTQQLRTFLAEAVKETLNESQSKLKVKMIDKVMALNLPFKKVSYELQVSSIVSDFFNTYFASSPEELAKMTQTHTSEEAPEVDDKDLAEPEEDPEEEPEEDTDDEVSDPGVNPYEDEASDPDSGFMDFL